MMDKLKRCLASYLKRRVTPLACLAAAGLIHLLFAVWLHVGVVYALELLLGAFGLASVFAAYTEDAPKAIAGFLCTVVILSACNHLLPESKPSPQTPAPQQTVTELTSGDEL